MSKQRESASDSIAAYHTGGAYAADLTGLPLHSAGDHALRELRNLEFFELNDLVKADVEDTRLDASRALIMRRAAFVACLYFEVLFDQALHHYYPEAHLAFAEQHAVPKFGKFGMGAHMSHPNDLLRGSYPAFVQARKHLEEVLAPAAAHFIAWTGSFTLPVASRDVWRAAFEQDWGDVGAAAIRAGQRALEARDLAPT